MSRRRRSLAPASRPSEHFAHALEAARNRRLLDRSDLALAVTQATGDLWTADKLLRRELRHTDVSLDEALVLSAVLNVPSPAALFLPANPNATVQLARDLSFDAGTLLDWVRGVPLNNGVTYPDEIPQRDLAYFTDPAARALRTHVDTYVSALSSYRNRRHKAHITRARTALNALTNEVARQEDELDRLERDHAARSR